MSAVVEAATQELLSSVQPQLFHQLASDPDLDLLGKIELPSLQELRDSADLYRSKVAEAVSLALVDYKEEGSTAALRQLASIRIFFEVLILEVGIRGDATVLASHLVDVQQRMRAVAGRATDFSEVAQEFWELDGEFHRTLCSRAGFSKVAAIVDDLVKQCAHVGVPKSNHEADLVLSEHDAVIDGIRERNTEKVVQATKQHIINAFKRWVGREAGMDNGAWDFGKIVQQGDDFHTSEAAFFQDLDELLAAHEGRWVLYRPTGRVAIVRSRRAAEKIAIKNGYPIDGYTIRLVHSELVEEPDFEMH